MVQLQGALRQLSARVLAQLQGESRGLGTPCPAACHQAQRGLFTTLDGMLTSYVAYTIYIIYMKQIFKPFFY